MGIVSVECVSCGSPRPDPVPLEWVRDEAEGDDAGRWLCPQCVRRHLRDIEAKLAPEWWG